MRKNVASAGKLAKTAVAALGARGLVAGSGLAEVAPAALAATSTAKAEKSEKVDTKAIEAEPFSMDVDCAACHKKAVKKMEKEGYTGALHASLECGMCHNEDDLVKVHTETEKYTAKKGDKVVALTKTAINEEACFACHGTLEELAETTKDSTVLTDENGLTVNPHDLPADHYGSKVMCGSCHKMHDTKEIEVSAANACLGCHHDNVYECGTCHAV